MARTCDRCDDEADFCTSSGGSLWWFCLNHAPDDAALSTGWSAKDVRTAIVTSAAPREIDDEMGKRTARWGLDDPALDGTDGAHPAWWRGNDDGVRAVVKIASDLLDGNPHVGTFGNADLERVAQRIAALRAERDRALRNAGRWRNAGYNVQNRLYEATSQLRSARERINTLEAQVLEQSFALAVTANDAETIRRQAEEIARLKGPCNVGTPLEGHRLEPCCVDCDWQ